ncbi:hypothetical protein K469DRAFT_748729 [Zopfia rhizophila CBS 207.26]|uniref:Uncharacterized protein n=1 Tax=Zopfia rhizophila CBS 207.26 TaxID=1314779 RepID=A0A6A6E7H9_9PEZI|nr:hypothetical protein K469DRAFT_748729 [Zopfia rhizophila CBS 207.26]
MKVPFITLAFGAIATASPFPWAEPTAVPAQTTGAALAPNGTNGTHPVNATRSGRHNPHKEPTPTFKLACECPKPIVPNDLLSTAEKCEFMYAAAMGCYYRAQGGCPSPTLAVNIFIHFPILTVFLYL